MSKGSSRRVGLVLALVSSLMVAVPLPSSAYPLGRSARLQESLWENVVHWLGGWWAGSSSVPRPLTSMRGNLGMGIDPDGKPSSAPSGDLGAGIDPDGRHSAPSGDAGMGIDPDGRH